MFPYFTVFRFCSLNNSFQEFSGLHYCLFVKVLFHSCCLSVRRNSDRISCFVISCQALFYITFEFLYQTQSLSPLSTSYLLATNVILSSPYKNVNRKLLLFFEICYIRKSPYKKGFLITHNINSYPNCTNCVTIHF